MEDLIRQNVRFERRDKEWESCKCRVCNDYKVRAAFSFSDTRIKFKCFNCGREPSFTKNSTKMHHEFREVLNGFGIIDNDIDLILGKAYFNKDQLVLAKKKAESRIEEVSLPEDSYQVTKVDEEDLWTIVASEYLETRGLSLDDHKWFLCSKEPFRDRLIIPYYKDGKIIYWQARSFLAETKKRYINATVPTEPVIFNYDELNRFTDASLFITEGVFDAISIGGASILGSKLYKQKIEAFNKSRRRKIFVIDKKDKQNNGYKLGLEVLKHGWEITYITSNNLADVNESVTKHGKLYTIRNLMENAATGFAAQVALETICKNHSAK